MTGKFSKYLKSKKPIKIIRCN